jgi:NNP family nitrate/nitrite transporter-like MFS transporter
LSGLGFAGGMLASSFIASKTNHKYTIIISSAAVGFSLFAVGQAQRITWIYLGAGFLGIAAGLYFPSAVVILTSGARNWGRNIAIHELAPNSAFLLAPFLVAAVSNLLTWREVLITLSVCNLAMAVLHIGIHSDPGTKSELISSEGIRSFISQAQYRRLVLMLMLAMAMGAGVYFLLPLFLITEKGLEPNLANSLVSLSYVLTIPLVFLAGWATDRIGPKPVLLGALLISGVTTILLALVDLPYLVPVILIQPLPATGSFVAAIYALSRLGSMQSRNIAVSLAFPIAYVIGVGLVPMLLGNLAERVSFEFGLLILGISSLVTVTILEARTLFSKTVT